MARPYRGLDNPHSSLYFVFYKGVFFFALLLTAFLLFKATGSVEYVWRWERVPQYFWAKGIIETVSYLEGTVVSITASGGETVIAVQPGDNGPVEEIYAQGTPDVLVAAGTKVADGTVLAELHYSRPGLLLEGLWVTLQVSAAAILFGIALGLFTGLARLSINPALRWGAITYIEVIRGSPLLVQIFLWYFVVGYLVDGIMRNFGLPPVPPLWYGVFALAIFTGAYVAEIVRAGIQSVNRGQMEAARSLGLTHAQAMRKVILPQAFRRIMPPLAGQFISLIKDSSLLGVMAVRELTKATREAVTSSFQSLELWFTCALLYLILTFTLSLFVQYLERRAIKR